MQYLWWIFKVWWDSNSGTVVLIDKISRNAEGELVRGSDCVGPNELLFGIVIASRFYQRRGNRELYRANHAFLLCTVGGCFVPRNDVAGLVPEVLVWERKDGIATDELKDAGRLLKGNYILVGTKILQLSTKNYNPTNNAKNT